MSWLFSRALVEEYSEASFSGGEPCAPSNVMPSPRPFSCSDKMMEFCPPSPFGVTLRLLTVAHGEALLMSYLAAFRARTLALPAAVRASRASDPGSGFKWPGSLAKYDPASRSWKTRQCSLLGGLDEFSETWPRWGSMRDGECLELEMSALPTFESESGLWPTPTRRDWRSESCSPEYAAKRNAETRGKTLAWAVRWPTPTVNGNYNKKGLSAKSGDGLATAVKKWPTPHGFSKDGRSNGPSGNELGRAVNLSLTKHGLYTTPCADDTGHRKTKYAQGGTALSAQVGGSLNPAWVEWLMGWPIEWTALKPLETAKFLLWPLSHGES